MDDINAMLGSIGNEGFDLGLESLIPSMNLVAKEGIMPQKRNKFAKVESAVQDWMSYIKLAINKGRDYDTIRAECEKTHNLKIQDELNKVFKSNITFKTLLTGEGGAFFTSTISSDTVDLWRSGDYSDYAQRLMKGNVGDTDEYITEMQQENNETVKNLKINDGIVNIKKAELGGYFSEVPVLIAGDPLTFLAYNFDYKHVTSILLHESGHMFDTFTYLNRMTRINIIANNVNNKLKEGAGSDVVVKMITKAGDAGILESDVMSAIRKGNDVLLPYQVMRVLNDTIVSVTNNYYSDLTNSESSADNFAVRCGYGSELLDVRSTFDDGSMLSKYEESVLGNYSGIVRIVSMVSATILLFIITVVGVMNATTFAGIIGYYFFLRMGLFALDAKYYKLDGSHISPGIYDIGHMGVKRIRDGIVEYLKSQRGKIHPTTAKQLRKDLDTLELFDRKYLKNKNVSTFINSSYKLLMVSDDEKKAMRVRDKLESLLANDAFVAAMEIELIETES